MIDLHERLSEFSYGYGVTREVEAILAAAGLKVTPFLPSLLHEKKLGFDVAFSGPGIVVMLQFKLGQQLSRFKKTKAVPSKPPNLQRPFWRFFVNTKEQQFRRLRKFERSGASVFYVAPRFSDWSAYEDAFHENKVLTKSLLVTPKEIRRGAKSTAGVHRLVYDKKNRYVCSEPIPIDEVSTEEFVSSVNAGARDVHFTLETRLEALESAIEGEENQVLPRVPLNARQGIEEKATSRSDARAAIVGLEAWIQGAQAVFVTP